MLTRKLLLLFILFSSLEMNAQCTNLGQNPETAFPVCGSSAFIQNTVAICGDRIIPTPCPDINIDFLDKNPYWYSFTCFAAGTLGFIITPNNLGDDYDWQLFDVTNHIPAEVYTNSSLFVACNWSGETGQTGSSSSGSSLVNCAGNGVPLYSKMPILQQGHNYLLLVSHFTDNSQSGYTLAFTGGTASITDTTIGRLLQSRAFCDGKRISIKLNKKLKCSSLASDGSDFTVSDSSVTVASVAAANCSNGFDMDSLVITLSNPLAPGNYSLQIKKGTDANTLLDNCDASVPDGDSLSFTVFPALPASIAGISTAICKPDEIQLTFDKSIQCNSVAADGSDFTITTPSAAVISSAATTCSSNLTTVVTLKLSQPIYLEGTHQVTIKTGSDGNTIINECALETAAGDSVSFTTKDTVSAAFNFSIHYGCKADTVAFFNSGDIGITLWSWRFSSSDTSAQQNPVLVYKTYGDHQVSLIVSNGACTDSAIAHFTLDNELKANFTAPVRLCPNDIATFKDTSIGKVLSWDWDFGNGSTSATKIPPQQVYPLVPSNRNFTTRLIVKNDHDCFDTAYKQVEVLYNCYIAVASAFTPNSDNLNDYLYPINAWKAKNLVFKVYNRFGQLVFKTEDFTKKWDGTINGIKQQTGTYVWTLQYVHEDTNQPFFLKGTTVLIR